MIRILQSPWLTTLIGCLTYLGVTAALLSPAKFEGALAAKMEAEEAAKAATTDVASWKFRNPEMEQWVNEMKREKEALELRTQELQELALRLEAERKELNAVTQMVSQLQIEFDRNVIRIREQEMENLKRQAKVFSGMSPETVATLVNDMAEDEAVKVLYAMKTDDVSAIMETLSKMGRTEARRAASLAEKLRRTLPPEVKPRAS